MHKIEPIGYFYSHQTEKYSVPRQPSLIIQNEGVIVLNPQSGFEQALEGLEEFDRIWIIFCFHRNQNWKPKVLPSRSYTKKGVFATRSPHRPNFIGLSCVQLKRIEGLKLFIGPHDLIDQTPILDLKPYLNYADSFCSERQGWLELLPEEVIYTIEWSSQALKQVKFLKNHSIDLAESIETRLRINPLPYPNNRIKQKAESVYELAYKTWRIIYSLNCQNIKIINLTTGYDLETLQGTKSSRWPDVALHQNFMRLFF